jgi:multiple sugar transport system substrate-binding protein
MRTTVRRGVAARIVVPVAALGLVAACGVGGGGGSGTSSASAGSSGLDLAAVKPEQLKGQTIKLARFFGDCEASTTGVTDVAKAKDECETIQILTNAFNAQNKYGIKVERLGGAEWNQYYDTLNAAYAGGTAPDVAVMHGSSLPDYARRNLLLKLDDQLGVTGVKIDDAAPAAREAISWQGGTYALPFDIHGALAHVNVDLFKKAGLVDASGAPKMPTSTDEFLAQAQQMKARTGKNYFGAARVKDALGVHMWRSLVEQQGSSIFTQDLTKAQVDTPEARTALDFMGKVFGPYADPNQTYDAAQAAFLKGDTAMLLNGTWVVNQYDKEVKFGYRAMDFPTLFQKPASWADSHTWAIPRQKTQDPVKTRAALEFVSYLYDHSGDWAIHTGHLAARQSVLNDPAYQKAPQRANYVATGTTNARLVPHIANWKGINDAVVAQMDSIWFQGAKPETAFAQANQQLDAILAKK